MEESGDHGLELVASVVAPSGSGEIAIGMVRSELSIYERNAFMPVIAHLMSPNVVLIHLKGAMRAAARAEPARIGR